MQKPLRRDDVVEALVELLQGRLRATFEKFCDEIPAHLERLSESGVASSDGREFVRVLLAWVGAESRRSEQASRYLLMWYVKSLASRRAHDTPDCRQVATLLRQELDDAEIAVVDRAIADKWENQERSRSLIVSASRLRKRFKASLTAEQQQRFEPYLFAFMPALPMLDAPHGHRPRGPAVATTGSSTVMSWTGAAIALGLPLITAIAWQIGRDDTAASHPASHRDHAPATNAPREPAPTPATAASVVPAVDPPSAPTPRPLRSAFVWSRRNSGAVASFDGVAWSGSRAVAVGLEGAIAWSADGERWRPAPQAPTYYYLAITYGADLFVAVGGNAYGTANGRLISISRDGVTWRSFPWADRAALNSVAHGAGAFVAVGNRGAIVRSLDGEHWQTVTSGSDAHLNGVEFADGRFVATGNGGTALTSPDGVTWTAAAPIGDGRYYRAAHGNGTWAAVGEHETDHGNVQVVARSSDLVTWSQQEVAGEPGLHGIVFVDGRFIGAGARGVMTSPDAVVWSPELDDGSFAAIDLVWTGTMLIAVGQRGAIFTALPAGRTAARP